MSERRELHCYDYVNHAYADVRRMLLADPAALFRESKLRVHVGDVEVAVEITLEVQDIDESRSPIDKPATQIRLTWHATHHSAIFPTMLGTLSAYALSPTETQLDFTGTYSPPLGIVGQTVDALALHRLAESSVNGFIKEVANSLRVKLAA